MLFGSVRPLAFVKLGFFSGGMHLKGYLFLSKFLLERFQAPKAGALPHVLTSILITRLVRTERDL